jgi:hypothetical protein
MAGFAFNLVIPSGIALYQPPPRTFFNLTEMVQRGMV